MKNRKGESWCIIVKNGVLLKLKNNDFFVTFYFLLRIDK
nr:MAG TPA: hypothetical protein [Caudoviricetes sp.]